MKLYHSDYYNDFHCLGGACPDNCCRQGWQIVIDSPHLEYYRHLSGDLGDKVLSAITTIDGEPCFTMENGACTLLREDGLCPLAAESGEEALCHICHTHPRFIEEYGGVREIHLSLSCPEAARLALLRNSPVAYVESAINEPVTTYNTINPEEYLFLRKLRRFSIAMMQCRAISIGDRFVLLLLLGKQSQKIAEQKHYKAAVPMFRSFLNAENRRKMLCRVRRWRLRGTNYMPELTVLRSLEHLSPAFPAILNKAVFTAHSAETFDRDCSIFLENLCVHYLAHYIPKAVNDGRIDTKIFFCVFSSFFVRRLAVCNHQAKPEDASAYASLLAKELEHSEVNMNTIYRALKNSGWCRHLISQIDIWEEHNAI